MQQLYARNLVPGLPRTADAQWRAEKGKRLSDLGSLQPGDQVFFEGTNGKGKGVASHTGFYLGAEPTSGKRLFVHASSTKGAVVVSDLDTYPLKPLGGKRYPQIDAIVQKRRGQGELPQGGLSPATRAGREVGAALGSALRPPVGFGDLREAEAMRERAEAFRGFIPPRNGLPDRPALEIQARVQAATARLESDLAKDPNLQEERAREQRLLSEMVTSTPSEWVALLKKEGDLLLSTADSTILITEPDGTETIERQATPEELAAMEAYRNRPFKRRKRR